MQQFRGGLVFKGHGLWYHSTLGLRVIKKKKTIQEPHVVSPRSFSFERYYAGGLNVILRPASFYDCALKPEKLPGMPTNN